MLQTFTNNKSNNEMDAARVLEISNVIITKQRQYQKENSKKLRANARR